MLSGGVQLHPLMEDGSDAHESTISNPNSAWKMTLQTLHTLHIFLHVPSDGAPLCPIFMFARECVPLDWECVWWCFAPAPPPPLFNTNLVIKYGEWKIHHLVRGFLIN